jgi:hypothetical protein
MSLSCQQRPPTGSFIALQFLNKGYIVDVASIAGGPIPIDPISLEPPANKSHRVQRFLADCKCWQHHCRAMLDFEQHWWYCFSECSSWGFNVSMWCFADHAQEALRGSQAIALVDPDMYSAMFIAGIAW